jgi:hypothetical protein
MAKNKVSEWSATPANNTDIGGINIAEGCAPSGINNAIRELMAQVKDMQAGSDSDGFVVAGTMTCSGPVIMSSTLTVAGASTFSNNVVMSANVTLGDAVTDTHSVTGVLSLVTGSSILLDDSVTTASAPPMAFDTDSNTGFFRPAADNIAIATGGVERVRVSNAGNVVVGSGEGTASVSGNTVRTPDAVGTNVAGSNLVIQSGNGTGTGGSGTIALRTAPVGGSGTAANTMAQRLLVTKNGGFSFGSGSTSYGSSGQVLRSAGDAPPAFGSVLTPMTAWVYSSNVTEITFTSIPSWVKKITVAISQLSTNSTGDVLLQIGYGSTYEATNYIGSVTNQSGTQETMSTGFKLVNSAAAASTYSGIITLVNLDGNTWCEQGTLGLAAGGTRESAGTKAISNSLTSLRLYIDGTQLFDGGSVNILYE